MYHERVCEIYAVNNWTCAHRFSSLTHVNAFSPIFILALNQYGLHAAYEVVVIIIITTMKMACNMPYA